MLATGPFRVVLQQLDIKLVEPRGGPNIKRTLADLRNRGDPGQRQEKPKVIRELGIGAGNGIGAAEVFRLKRLAVGGQNELGLGRCRLGAGAQGLERFIHLAGGAGDDMDIAALKHATNIRLVGIAGAQALDCGVLVAKGAQELKGELGPVKRLKRKVGYGFFDFNGIHAGHLRAAGGHLPSCGME